VQNIDQILASSGMDVSQLGARFGLSPDQTRLALGSLMPAILGGFHKQAEGPGVPVGDAGVVEPTTPFGNDILGQIFGSKDVSRQVADHAAGQSGVSNTVLKAMLPIVAAMVARYIATNGAAAGGGIGGLLASALSGTGGLAGGLGGMFGGTGSPLDAILKGLRR
jgi:hypothetical protein